MSNHCIDCKHSTKPEELKKSALNVCTRFPPAPIVVPMRIVAQGMPPFDVQYVQPLVNDKMTCGEFSVKLAVLQ